MQPSILDNYGTTNVPSHVFEAFKIHTLFFAQTNNSVTSLDLSGNNIGHEGLLDILRMLDENTSITYLVSRKDHKCLGF